VAHDVKDFLTPNVLVGLGAVVMVMALASCGGGAESMRSPSSTTSTTEAVTNTSGSGTDDALNLACTYAQETLDQVRSSRGRGFEADVERYLAQIDDAHNAEQTAVVAARIQAVQQAIFDLEDADRPNHDVKPAIATVVRAINALGC
jgi:hypothetical protein